MSQHLEDLLVETTDDPGQLLQLAATFIDNAASSKKLQIAHYHDLISKVFDEQEKKSPLIKPLRALINGITNYYLTHYKKAKADLSLAIELYKPGIPTDILGAIYFAKALVYRSLGEIDIAVENLFLASETLYKDGYFKITYAYVFYQLGEIHISIGEYENAEIYYQEALAIISLTEDTTANFRVNNGLGNCYLHLDDYSKSLEYLNIALGSTGISAAEKARGLCDLGIVSLRQNDIEKALDYLIESLEIRKTNNLEDAASTSLLHLGEAYLMINDLDNAQKVLEESMSIIEKFNVLGKKIKVCRLLAETYEKNGDAIKALSYFNEYDRLNIEVRSSQEHRIFRLKNKQIESQKQQVHEKNVQLKDTLNELAKVKNSRKSLFFSIGTAITLVILTEAFFDPLVEEYSYNVYISLGVKVLIALLLKPMESFYERILFRKAMKLN